MYLFILYLNILNLIKSSSFPSCHNCKWFLPNKKTPRYDYGFCRIFKNNIDGNGNKFILYDFATHCRENEKLCGSSGILYENGEEIQNGEEKREEEKREDEEDGEKDKEEIQILVKQYDELNSHFSGEVIEKNEIDEIEKELLIIFQKLKKYRRKQLEMFAKSFYEKFKIFLHYTDQKEK
jgi:hypothetical protein